MDNYQLARSLVDQGRILRDKVMPLTDKHNFIIKQDHEWEKLLGPVLDLFSRATESCPQFGEAYFERGLTLLLMGRSPSHSEDFLKAWKLITTLRESQVEILMAFYKGDERRILIREALETSELGLQATNILKLGFATSFFQEKKYQDCVTELEKLIPVIQDTRLTIAALSTIAKCYEVLGQSQRAKKIFERISNLADDT